MNKLLLALVAVLAVAAVSASAQSDAQIREMFTNFMHEHKITYGVHEFQYRYGVFKSNVELINAHNQRADTTFTMGVNRFADFTNEEYRYRMLGYRHDPRRVRKNVQPALLGTEGLPDVVDWRDKNAVTPVKDQGQCGSCWAFSATGSIEGTHAVAKGQLISVSEQQLVDCSRSYGNMGCNGGLMDYSFEYVIDNKGINSDADYPYQSGTGNDRYQCRFQANNVATSITGYVNVAAGSESSLQAAVANHGPVSVAIDAGHSSFQFYRSGIYNEPRCSSSMLNHGVLAIGYGNNGTADFWMIKNSWGTGWGDKGWIKMSRNANNQCGIATAASYATM